MAPHSSTLAWKIPWTEEPGRLQSVGSLRVGHDWATSHSLFTFMHWRRTWQPTPVFLPGESQEQGSLVPGGLPSMGSHRVGHDWSDLAAAAAVAKLCPTLWDPMECSMPSSSVLHCLLEFAQIHVHWVGNAIQPSHPLPLPSPCAFNLSQCFNESALRIRWPKYWSLSFSISPSNEYSRLISFRSDWFDLAAVQGTLKSLFQHHSLKASILWWSAFLMVQFSHPYTTTGKTIAVTIQSKDEYTDAKNWLIWKDPDAGKDWKWEEKGTTEDEMVGWHHPPTRWTWVWVSSGSWWWPGKPGVLQSMGSQRVRHN